MTRWLAVLWLAVFCGLTYRRIVVWQDARSLWSDAVQTAPCSMRAHWNLAQAYDEDSAERLSELQQAARLSLEDVPRCR